MVATKAHALVELQSQPAERFYDILLSTRYKTGGVGIFNAENEIAAMLAGKKVIIQSCTHSTYVQGTCRTRSKAYSYSSFSHIRIVNFAQKYYF